MSSVAVWSVWLPIPLVVVVVFSVVPERIASKRVDNNEDGKDDDVDNGDFLPMALDVLKHTCLTSVAVVAQGTHIVAPQVAICVWGCCSGGFCPAGWAHVRESTVI